MSGQRPYRNLGKWKLVFDYNCCKEDIVKTDQRTHMETSFIEWMVISIDLYTSIHQAAILWLYSIMQNVIQQSEYCLGHQYFSCSLNPDSSQWGIFISGYDTDLWQHNVYLLIFLAGLYQNWPISVYKRIYTLQIPKRTNYIYQWLSTTKT